MLLVAGPKCQARQRRSVPLQAVEPDAASARGGKAETQLHRQADPEPTGRLPVSPTSSPCHLKTNLHLPDPAGGRVW